MYHVATPPEPGETEYFEMASEGDGDWVCAVTASGTEHFWIGDDVAECPEDESGSWMRMEEGALDRCQSLVKGPQR